MVREEKQNINWGELGFAYIKTDWRYIARWKNGTWEPGMLTADNTLHLNENACGINYGQQCFEGLKAVTLQDGRVALWRPHENARRMQRSAGRLMMPHIPEDLFIDACKQVVAANINWVPPYGFGAAFYLRPLLIAAGGDLRLKPADEYLFTVFGMPVGPYFKRDMKPVCLAVSSYDRAAPNGTGSCKTGCNYAGAFQAQYAVHADGFSDCMYLDPQTHTYIEEVGSANFFGITEDNRLVTPESPSILPSTTLTAVTYIAEKFLNMKIERRPVSIDSLDEFIEAGACGTAAVITPVGAISHNGNLHTFYRNGTEVGPVIRYLHNIFSGMQSGAIKTPAHWLEYIYDYQPESVIEKALPICNYPAVMVG